MVKSFEVGDTFATSTSGGDQYRITRVDDSVYYVKVVDGTYETSIDKGVAHRYLESNTYVPTGATALVGKHFRTSNGDGPVHVIERLDDPDYHDQNSVRIRMVTDEVAQAGTIWGASRVQDIIDRGDWVVVDSDSVDVVKDPTPHVNPGDKLRATVITPSSLLATLQREGNDVGELIRMSGSTAYVSFPNDSQLYVDEWELVKGDDLIGKTFKIYDTIYKIGESQHDDARYSLNVWSDSGRVWSNGTGGTYDKEAAKRRIGDGTWVIVDDPSASVAEAAAPVTDETSMLASLREQLAAAQREAETARDDERRRIVTSLDSEAESREWCTEYDEWLAQEGLADYSSRDVDVDVTVTATFTVSVPRSALDSSDTRYELFARWSPSQYDIDEWEVN